MTGIMMYAILGDRYHSAPTAAFLDIKRAVEDYIDRSTGIRTLAQMQWRMARPEGSGSTSSIPVPGRYRARATESASSG